MTSILAAFVALRVAGVEEDVGRFFALVTITGYLVVPATAVTTMALLLRRRMLVVTSVVVTVALVIWTAPDLRWWSTEDREFDGAEFTIAAANLYRGNAEYRSMFDDLRALDADVLVLVEYTPAAEEAFVDLGIEQEYPYSFVDARRSSFGSAVYSRFELTDGAVLDVAGYPTASASVLVDGAPVDVVAVHTLQPLAGVEILHEQLGRLAEIGASRTTAVLLAGDFNATRQHAAFRALLDDGLHDAHHSLGSGLATTWPVGNRGPRFALLDHVVGSDDLVFTSVAERTITGSDHRAVLAAVGVDAP